MIACWEFADSGLSLHPKVVVLSNYLLLVNAVFYLLKGTNTK